MEAFQPILLALLALNLAVFVALVVRTVRERRERRREQTIVDAATPRMRLRLAAIADASIVLEDPVLPPSPRTAMPETTDVAPVAVAMATAAAVPTAGARPAADEVPDLAPRRVWRDASLALSALVCIGLLVAIAVSGPQYDRSARSSRRWHPGANAAADADRRHRADRPAESSPSVAVAVAATDRARTPDRQLYVLASSWPQGRLPGHVGDVGHTRDVPLGLRRRRHVVSSRSEASVLETTRF